MSGGMFKTGLREYFFKRKIDDVSSALCQMVDEFGYVPVRKNIGSIGGAHRGDGWVHIPVDNANYESATVVFVTNINPKSGMNYFLKPRMYKVLGSINRYFGSAFRYLPEDEIPVTDMEEYKQKLIRDLEDLSIKLAKSKKEVVRTQ